MGVYGTPLRDAENVKALRLSRETNGTSGPDSDEQARTLLHQVIPLATTDEGDIVHRGGGLVRRESEVRADEAAVDGAAERVQAAVGGGFVNHPALGHG